MTYAFDRLPLLEDFDVFMRYLRAKAPVALTNTAAELKFADLVALNEQMQGKAPGWVTPRSRQPEYPLLNFFFGLATSAKLFTVRHDKGYQLVANSERLERYDLLTDAERYFFLLETFWCYTNWSMIDATDRPKFGTRLFSYDLKQVLDAPANKPLRLFQRGWVLEGDKSLLQVDSETNTAIRLMHAFGWIDPKELTFAKKPSFEMQFDGFTLTDWGRTVLTILQRERPYRHWNQHDDSYLGDDDEEKEVRGAQRLTFLEPFRQLLNEPGLESLYPISLTAATGEYRFRLTSPYHKFSRLLSIRAGHTLDDLHGLIQQAVEFDNDHLYGFYLDVKNPYSGRSYNDPRGYEGPFADAVAIGELELHVGQRLLYIFDFGDNWEFLLTLEDHRPDEAKEGEPAVLESVGKAPVQYDWEDE